MLRNSFYKCATIFVITLSICTALTGQDIPLPEHPRPDFERATWINLNGNWDFAFDSLHVGEEDSWFTGKGPYPDSIQVPFPWGSALSGLDDLADVGWYRRKITVPSSWESKRTFLTIGASDWETTLWLDGVLVGNHRGGYIPFSFELTEFLKYSESQTLVIRVDDARRDFTLYGKQGYGNARGIWQTVYLEARGPVYLDALHFLPDIDNELVEVRAYLPMSVSTDQELSISIQTDEKPITHRATLTAGSNKLRFTVEVPDPHLWSLDDPHLYWVNAKLGQDEVSTYFGMRKISTTILPNSDHIYVSLNNQPIYLQMALDQSYHPDGFYTFPSDQFLQEEIDRSKKIGLNGIRTHIKVEVPRKLYWADKKGLLVMEDLPNSWGEPDASMQAESEYTLRQMIKRDFNHPGIFSWCVFNETWGLKTQVQDNGVSNNRYLPETQDWVASMYYLAKSLDQTRLVEDNSI
ncbi:MAG: glycoside hydrolase family 2, partial [Saprospiraceae bacterium]|nr:glycoside hydrolase family 2 [Saprospiraceae bacterium]